MVHVRDRTEIQVTTACGNPSHSHIVSQPRATLNRFFGRDPDESLVPGWSRRAILVAALFGGALFGVRVFVAISDRDTKVGKEEV